ncbi:MAG: hypothetical protein SFV54_15255 [Bryobacteraceae bacterium]|nr:hypothetical protein [Bryobacteraceae bacterium]
MIEAQLRGKLAQLADSEDLLTSSAFGLLKFSPLRPVLAEFLSRATRYGDGREALGTVLSPSGLLDCEAAQIRFWERHGEFGEPDLLLVGIDWAMVVEVKLGAEVSGDDQLRRYHALLVDRFPRAAQRHVVYLTMDLSEPALSSEVTRGIERNLWWLSWYELAGVLEHGSHNRGTHELARDLRRLLDYHGLLPFQGISAQDVPVAVPLFWDGVSPLITPQDAWPASPLFWKENPR